MDQRLRKRFTTLACAALVGLAGAAFAAAPAAAKAKAKAPAKPKAGAAAPAALQGLAVSGLELSLHGDSTLHKWEAKAAQVTLTASLKAGKGPLLDSLLGGGLASLTLTVTVDALHSPEGSSMDKNMHKALGSDKFPEVTFIVKNYHKEGEAVLVTGDLSIHGATKEVTLPAKLEAAGSGVKVSGSYDLNMSEYNTPPPVMMMGTIRTKDKVSIVFSFNLAGI